MLGKLFRRNHSKTPSGPEATGTADIISVRSVGKSFKVGTGEVAVLKNINLDVEKGEFVGIIGKSGSGKSTLVNMLTGIDRPTSGEVFVGGVPVHTLDENELAVWRGRNLGIVFQFFQLLPMLSLVENIMLPMDFCHMYASGERRQRAMALLDMVGMADQADKLPTALSGGQQQRVAIARALANDPPILFADEPTGNLDSRTAEDVFRMFETLVREGHTIVMVTHDSSLAKRVTQTVLIADGEIVNEWVVKALPTLTHQQMLEATHRLKAERFQPGQVIMQQEQPGDRFYIIMEGVVNIALQRPGGSEVVVTQMGPGQYFGEIELLRHDRSVATVRAAQAPVDVVALSEDAFMELLAESETTRDALQHVMRQRLRENVAARREVAAPEETTP